MSSDAIRDVVKQNADAYRDAAEAAIKNTVTRMNEYISYKNEHDFYIEALHALAVDSGVNTMELGVEFDRERYLKEFEERRKKALTSKNR